jgi:hypothetical protein
MGHRDTALEQQFFPIAVAEGESIIQPDPVADDLAGKAVILVTLSGGWSRHVWLPIPEFHSSWRSIIGVMMSWRKKESQQVDKTSWSAHVGLA